MGSQTLRPKSIKQRKRVSVTADISGDARAEGALRIIKKLGFSAHSDILASASLTARPKINTNWRLDPNLSETDIDIHKAHMPIKHIGSIGLGNHIRPALKITLDKLRAKLDKNIANNNFLERAAKESWNRLCRSTPLGSDSGL